MLAQGLVVAGHGQAGNSLAKQIPKIAEGGFPEIRDVHPATINIQFQEKIIVAGADHRTAPIRWDVGQGEGEIFDLVRVRLRFGNSTAPPTPALLYVSQWTVYRNDPHMHEFLAAKVNGLRTGMSAFLECDRRATVLPYGNGWIDWNGRRRLAKTVVIL
jgi:hypothetical protein